MNNIHKYESRGFAFSSWLFRIAISEISNAVKKNQTERAMRIQSQEISELEEEIEFDYHDARMTKLVELLNELNDSDLDMIEMRYFEKRKLKDVAEIMEITEANAKVKMHRIMARLKAKAKS